ncbi:alpha/beta hydrolase [Microbacterium sp. A93]|uniref:alpha/beta hydrolase n=1 Tax=Microbacterium sp. A93 TaxID=3450716 RepID=UPI003F422957
MTVTQTARPEADEYLPSTPPRGLIVVVQGRADAAQYYTRFGRRLAADGYVVRVPTHAAGSATEVAELWDNTIGPERPDGPVIAVTVDAGGGFLAQTLRARLLTTPPDGVVLTGLALDDPPPGAGTSSPADVTARSACPVHRAVVDHTPVDVLSDAHTATVLPRHQLETPTLVIHGSADEVSPLARLRETWTAGPVELNVVSGGLHDVLNDVHHRSVAALIVSFAERLRLSPDAAEIILRESL